jgi:hypothetical protein
MLVVMRTADAARDMANKLKRPYFILWDKNQMTNRFEPPTNGIVCTTAYEAPYLNADYVALPNCMDGYWPYQKEKNLENARRMFLRAASSSRLATYFLIPDPTLGILASQFISEGCTPKLVTKVATITLST